MISAKTQRYTESCFKRIVFTTIVVNVEEFFKPLQELKIILKTAANQFIDGNDLCKTYAMRTDEIDCETANNFGLKILDILFSNVFLIFYLYNLLVDTLMLMILIAFNKNDFSLLKNSKYDFIFRYPV